VRGRDELATLKADKDEPRTPTTAKQLGKRRPKALYEELQRAPKTDFRLELLTRP
jgi:hypothetical protein